MTELERITVDIEKATVAGRARHEADMRAVDILHRRAEAAEPAAALAMLLAAKEILSPSPTQETPHES